MAQVVVVPDERSESKRLAGSTTTNGEYSNQGDQSKQSGTGGRFGDGRGHETELAVSEIKRDGLGAEGGRISGPGFLSKRAHVNTIGGNYTSKRRGEGSTIENIERGVIGDEAADGECQAGTRDGEGAVEIDAIISGSAHAGPVDSDID